MLEQLGDGPVPDGPSAEGVRHSLFRAAAALHERSLAIERAARELDLAPELVIERLLSDLPQERLLRELPPSLSPAELALRSNGQLAAAFLKQSRRVRVQVRGWPRHVLRQARRLGLVCVVTRGARSNDVVLEISGPLALFRHTRVYGRALSSLLPELAAMEHYELRAECSVSRAQTVTVTIKAGDPLAPAGEPRPEAGLEQRFVREFRRATRAWRLVLEPDMIEAGPVLVLPDFEIVSSADPSRRWFVELLGFWTPALVEQRLLELRAAGIPNFIVCVRGRKNCGDGGDVTSPHVVRWGSRGNAARILELIER